MNIDSTLEDLIGLLKQETGLYRSMRGVIDQEREAAVRSDLDVLHDTGIEKERILAEIHKMEAKRRQLVAALAEQLGCNSQDLTLTKIAQLVGEPRGASLRLVSKEFSAVLSRLQVANQRNQLIFKHSLALIGSSFNMLNELLTPNTVYYRTGNIKSSKSTGKCISSEI